MEVCGMGRSGTLRTGPRTTTGATEIAAAGEAESDQYRDTARKDCATVVSFDSCAAGESETRLAQPPAL